MTHGPRRRCYVATHSDSIGGDYSGDVFTSRAILVVTGSTPRRVVGWRQPAPGTEKACRPHAR